MKPSGCWGVKESATMRYTTYLHKTHFLKHLHNGVMLYYVYNTYNGGWRPEKK